MPTTGQLERARCVAGVREGMDGSLLSTAHSGISYLAHGFDLTSRFLQHRQQNPASKSCDP